MTVTLFEGNVSLSRAGGDQEQLDTTVVTGSRAEEAYNKYQPSNTVTNWRY